MKEYFVGEGDAGMRLNRFVEKVCLRMPAGAMHRAFRKRRIKLNGKRAAPDARLAAGDHVELYLNDEFFAPPAAENKPQHPLPGLVIVYQNEHIALLHKPAGVLSHRDEKDRPGLAEAFAAQLAAAGGPAAAYTPSLANRLDRNTEGLLLAAKTHAAARDAAALLRGGHIAKRYLAVTRGAPPKGRHSAYLQRDRAAHRAQISPSAETPGAKAIETGVEILEAQGGLALCEIDLFTGRTHQIRAHLAHLGAPLLGDAKYGGGHAPGAPGQLLCAWRLAFAPGLPADNLLAPLAGRVFTLRENGVLRFWAAHCAAAAKTTPAP